MSFVQRRKARENAPGSENPSCQLPHAVHLASWQRPIRIVEIEGGQACRRAYPDDVEAECGEGPQHGPKADRAHERTAQGVLADPAEAGLVKMSSAVTFLSRSVEAWTTQDPSAPPRPGRPWPSVPGVGEAVDALRRSRSWDLAEAIMLANDMAMLWVMFLKPSLVESCLIVGIAGGSWPWVWG